METTPEYLRAVAAEPRLRAVGRVIKALAALNVMEGTAYDAVIRPLVAPLVGWSRGRHFHAHNPEDMPKPEHGMILMSQIPEPIITKPEPATDEEAWLRTQKAYDAVIGVYLDYLADNTNPMKKQYRL